MAKANSFKSQPWSQLQRGTYTVFDDDFISDKLTLKFTKKAAGSTVALKDSFHFSKEGKIDKSQEEIKFWIPFRDTHTIYFRLKNDGIKLHYDRGVQQQNGYKLNWYGSWQSKRNFTVDTYKVGLEVRKDNWSTNFRLAWKPLELGAFVYNKTSFSQNKWNFGFVNAFKAIQNQWIHSALQIGWQDQRGNDYYVRTNAGKKYEKINPSHYLNNVVFNYIHKYNGNNNLGVEVKANLAAQELGTTSLVWDHKCQSSADRGFKLKVDSNHNVAASVKNPISGYGNYIFGVNIHDFGRQNRFTYGIQIDLNL